MSGDENGSQTANRETLRLRDLLEFDFFCPPRREFAEKWPPSWPARIDRSG